MFNFNKEFIFYTFLSCAAFLFLSSQVNAVAAHTLEINNGVSAVMHIVPDDKAVANTPTTLEFQITDPNQDFNLKNCVCEISIKDQSKTIQSTTLQPSSIDGKNIGSAIVIFPSVGVYTVQLSGQSINSSFPGFNMSYIVRADSPTKNSSVGSLDKVSIYIMFACFVAIVCILVYVYSTGGWSPKK
jgi:hypothetical protein